MSCTSHIPPTMSNAQHNIVEYGNWSISRNHHAFNIWLTTFHNGSQILRCAIINVPSKLRAWAAELPRTSLSFPRILFYLRPRTDTSNVMRILRLDVTAIIACNAHRMVRSDRRLAVFSSNTKDSGLARSIRLDVFQRVCVCRRVFVNKENWNVERREITSINWRV
jgi:hypothetical protein